MHTHSERAMEIAQTLVDEVFYPRMADMVAKVIANCEADMQPLNADQEDAVYRAAFAAGDGVYAAIAYEIDQRIPRDRVTPFRAGIAVFDPEAPR